MTGEENGLQGYLVNVTAVKGTPGTYDVSYVSRSPQQERGIGGKPIRVPKYRAQVRTLESAPVTWHQRPAEGPAMQQFDDDARRRVRLLHEWLERLNRLVETVRSWVEDLGWSTKVI